MSAFLHYFFEGSMTKSKILSEISDLNTFRQSDHFLRNVYNHPCYTTRVCCGGDEIRFPAGEGEDGTKQQRRQQSESVMSSCSIPSSLFPLLLIHRILLLSLLTRPPFSPFFFLNILFKMELFCLQHCFILGSTVVGKFDE